MAKIKQQPINGSDCNANWKDKLEKLSSKPIKISGRRKTIRRAYMCWIESRRQVKSIRRKPWLAILSGRRA